MMGVRDDRPRRSGAAPGGNARHRDAHPGGSGRGGATIGHADRGYRPIDGRDADAGDIRLSIAELRERAALERSSGPTPCRRITLDVAALTGWPIEQVERLTFADVSYIVRELDRRARAIQDRSTARTYRRRR